MNDPAQISKLDLQVLNILEEQLNSLSNISTTSDLAALQVMALRSMTILIKGLYKRLGILDEQRTNGAD